MWPSLFLDPSKNSILSSCIYVFDENGILKSDKRGSNTDLADWMPMASTVKIAIALALAKLVTENQFNLDEIYLIKDEDIVPGLPNSFLDKKFFISETVEIQITLRELLNNMIKTSDNTAADYILKLIGGPEVVNLLIRDELGIKSFSFQTTMRNLLSSYYHLDCTKTPENIQTAIQVLRTAFNRRETEDAFFSERKDSCTTKAMAKLLHKITFPNQKNSPEWLKAAAPLVMDAMKLCETNKNKMRKGIYSSNIADNIEFCAGKTGSLGSISNDVSIVKTTIDNNELYILIAIYSGLSSLEPMQRNELIADTARDLINQCFIPTSNCRLSY